MAEVSLLQIALRWISLDLTDDKLTLVQVMAWITWANVDPDPWYYMVSKRHNEFNWHPMDIKK